MINSKELDRSVSDLFSGPHWTAKVTQSIARKILAPAIPTVPEQLAREDIQRMVSDAIGETKRDQFLRKKHQDHMFNEKRFNTVSLFALDGDDYFFGGGGIVDFGRTNSTSFQQLFFEVISGYGFDPTKVEESTGEPGEFKLKWHPRLSRTTKVHTYPSQTVQGLTFIREDFFYEGRNKPKWVEWSLNYTVPELQFDSRKWELFNLVGRAQTRIMEGVLGLADIDQTEMVKLEKQFKVLVRELEELYGEPYDWHTIIPVSLEEAILKEEQEVAEGKVRKLNEIMERILKNP